MINEGVKDKAALKFVFLAGGPGSGKTYQANKLFGIDKGVNFSKDGFKMVSFDEIFERVLEEEGWPSDLTELDPKEQAWVMSDHPDAPRGRARNLMKARMKLMAKNQTGMIFDGTGSNAYSYLQRKKEMEDLGYDVSLVFVDTDLETALERNAKRERRLPDSKVKQAWEDVQKNKETYKKHFADNMVVINNSEGAAPDETLPSAIHRIINRPIQNKFGQKLLQTQDDPTKLQGLLKQQKAKLDAEAAAKAKAAAEKAKADAAKWKSKEPVWDDDPFWAKQKPKGGSSSKSKGPETVKNPVTGNDIKIKTALDYPKDHPAHKAADAVKGEKPKSSQPLLFGKSDHPTYLQKYFDKQKDQDKSKEKFEPRTPKPEKKKGGFKQYFDFWKKKKQDDQT
jgi:adenylate kinase family enzyme